MGNILDFKVLENHWVRYNVSFHKLQLLDGLVCARTHRPGRLPQSLRLSLEEASGEVPGPQSSNASAAMASSRSLSVSSCLL